MSLWRQITRVVRALAHRTATDGRALETVVADITYGIRRLQHEPGFAVASLLTLALGVGANTAIFSTLDSLLLRALPVKDPARLVLITEGDMVRPRAWSYPVWRQIQQRPDLFERTAAWSFTRFNLSSTAATRFATGMWASGSFFDTLGVPALIGRTFSDADDRPGGGPSGPVAVISTGFWQHHFGGATDVVGRPLPLDGVTVTVVGVMPPHFFGAEVGRTFDVIVPIAIEPMLRGADTVLDSSGTTFLTMVARLRPTQTLDSAIAELRGVQSQIRDATLGEIGRFGSQQAIERYLKPPLTLLPAATGASDLRLRYQRPLLTIMVVAGLILLIACVNIANLSLARATARRHEVSVRLALGASRWRVVRQLLTESLVLSTAGAALGLGLSVWTSRGLVYLISTPSDTVFVDLSLDWHVLAFTLGLIVLTTMFFAMAPAIRTSGVGPIDAMKEQGRSGAHARGGAADSLVVVQVALSMALVVSAGLFVRTFISLAQRPLGFDASRVLVVGIDAGRAAGGPSARMALYGRVHDVVNALPDVTAAALSLTTPLGGGQFTPTLELTGGPALRGQGPVWGNLVSPGWFATFGTPLVGGRDFTGRDRQGAPRVAVVNEALARRIGRDGSPVGRSFTLYPRTARALGPIEIVGVVADAVYASRRAPAPPTFYVPIAQFDHLAELGIKSINLSVRTDGQPPLALVRSITGALSQVDAQLALTFRPLAEQVDQSLTQERILALLAGLFGVLALLLAGVGLYGVTSYAVTRRRAELGIRIALGAAPPRVLRLVLSRVAFLVGTGLTAGAGLCLWLAPLLATLLYGLEPRDPATLGGAATMLIVVAGVASWWPAWRAARIDPADVLRQA